MSCWDTVQKYAFQSIGFGERTIPSKDITLCDQFTLIGSGMIVNLYFGVLAIAAGFVFANALAMGKFSSNPWARKPAEWFIFLFRGSPLFIQFFFAYFLFINLKGVFPVFGPLTAAWLGALVVLFLNTAAYSAEIFYGALLSIPKGDMEAADAYGLTGWSRFRRVMWPTMMRLAWPAYTNEAIFLFHATTLVYFSGFPIWRQQGDALYYAKHIADKTYNPFLPYPILAGYFILLTLLVIFLFGLINTRLNRHMPQSQHSKIKYKPNLMR